VTSNGTDRPGASAATEGCVILKSAACAPLLATTGLPVRFNAAVPTFRMVKVCLTLVLMGAPMLLSPPGSGIAKMSSPDGAPLAAAVSLAVAALLAAPVSMTAAVPKSVPSVAAGVVSPEGI